MFVTHGNVYGVSLGTERILDEAYSRGVQIAVFGHTHRPLVEQHGNLYLINPGSLCYPRQMGRVPSYIKMDFDRDHEVHFEICFLEK